MNDHSCQRKRSGGDAVETIPIDILVLFLSVQLRRTMRYKRQLINFEIRDLPNVKNLTSIMKPGKYLSRFHNNQVSGPERLA